MQILPSDISHAIVAAPWSQSLQLVAVGSLASDSRNLVLTPYRTVNLRQGRLMHLEYTSRASSQQLIPLPLHLVLDLVDAPRFGQSVG